MKNPRSILITGATSGIGKELARIYASPGVFLALSGRNGARLSEIDSQCRMLGAKTETAILDITDQLSVQKWIESIDANHPLDLVIANAGISYGTAQGTSVEEQAREIHATNFIGVLNTVRPIIPLMEKRHRGQIALMSSLAAFRARSSSCAYSASKIAVKNYGESLRDSLCKVGISVSIICPGFVRTPLLEATNSNPLFAFALDAVQAAKIIRRELIKNKALIAFPKTLYGLFLVASLLPPAWLDTITNCYLRKNASR